jgi:hypothetical protein
MIELFSMNSAVPAHDDISRSKEPRFSEDIHPEDHGEKNTV